jgi:hypothetical protein
MSRLLEGRARVAPDLTVHLSEREGADLHDKMRQAYWWIVNNAILCPYYDVEYGRRSNLKNTAGDEVLLHDAMSYSSFVLIPMLTLFSCRRALLVGGPGRGKTTSAILMALVAGMTREEVRRSIQRGHPQLSIADLLGAPLPSDMLKAEDMSAVKIGWRKWISQRVKIIDEYNRIPTKTQSALLSLMAEGYAEMFDQYVYAGRSSWFLTANDDAGGGTLAVALGDDVRERLGFFLGQLDFCRMASPQFEAKSKDTLRLGGQTVSAVCNEQCPLDKKVHLCTQTENGVSARAYQTGLHFAKALAYFRGHGEVELEDVRQILPFVLHDMAMEQYPKHEPVRKKVRALREELDEGLQGVEVRAVEKRMAQITSLMEQLMKGQELSGPVYEDLIHLKSMYSRYQNYAHWLKQSGAR